VRSAAHHFLWIQPDVAQCLSDCGLFVTRRLFDKTERVLQHAADAKELIERGEWVLKDALYTPPESPTLATAMQVGDILSVEQDLA
jgi:hypothetical protein